MMVHDYHVLSIVLILNGVRRFGSQFRSIKIKNVDKVENDAIVSLSIVWFYFSYTYK
jgi:hypothetical protein